jgi:hypothetical protein
MSLGNVREQDLKARLSTELSFALVQEVKGVL